LDEVICDIDSMSAGSLRHETTSFTSSELQLTRSSCAFISDTRRVTFYGALLQTSRWEITHKWPHLEQVNLSAED